MKVKIKKGRIDNLKVINKILGKRDMEVCRVKGRGYIIVSSQDDRIVYDSILTPKQVDEAVNGHLPTGTHATAALDMERDLEERRQRLKEIEQERIEGFSAPA